MGKWRGAGTLVLVSKVLEAMPVKLQSQNLALQLQSVLLKQLHIGDTTLCIIISELKAEVT